MTTRPTGRIEIGPYVDILRTVALEGAPIPDSVDLSMARILELDGDVYYYREPLLDRKEGVNVVRFYVGGFLTSLRTVASQAGPRIPTERGQLSRSIWSIIRRPRN